MEGGTATWPEAVILKIMSGPSHEKGAENVFTGDTNGYKRVGQAEDYR